MKINKKYILDEISKRLNQSIHKSHIRSIINILIEEIVKELKNGNDIIIKGFGNLSLKKLKVRKMISINNNIKFARRTKSLRFSLTRKISKLVKQWQEIQEK
jgi:nucleoid DNA-binding protein